jgi:hypothetical protein
VEGGTVSVAVAGSRTEADVIVGLLRSHGLRAAVAADDAGRQEPALQLSSGVRVLVAASDEDAAREVIAAENDIPEIGPPTAAPQSFDSPRQTS